MKKQLLVLVIGFFALSIHAQLILTQTTPGVVDVEYSDNAGSWDLYDPQGDTDIYAYLWVEVNQATPNLDELHQDYWFDHASLVKLTHDGSKFVGVIDFNTHDFLNQGNLLPNGISLDDFNIILRNEAGDQDSQSADLLATDYGFVATSVTVSVYDFKAENASFYANGALHLSGLTQNEQVEVHIVDSLGRQIFKSQFVVSQEETILDISSLQAKVAIVQVRTSADKYFVKKIVL